MQKANKDIRLAVKRAGIFFWQIADKYGINDSNFSRLLRKELDANTKARIYAIIEELKQEKCSQEAV